MSQIDVVLNRPFPDDHALRNAPVQHVHGLGKALERPDLRVVPRQDAGRLHDLEQALRDERQQAIHPLRECLHHQIVAVPVDDQRRQQVRFAVDETIRARVELQGRSIPDRGVETYAHQRLIRRILAAREHADRDLRPIAEQRRADDAPARPDHLHEVAAGRVDRDDVRVGQVLGEPCGRDEVVHSLSFRHCEEPKATRQSRRNWIASLRSQ